MVDTGDGFNLERHLQDIERSPAFGATEAHLQLSVTPVGKAEVKPAGASQFAVFPHQDFVLRVPASFGARGWRTVFA